MVKYLSFTITSLSKFVPLRSSIYTCWESNLIDIRANDKTVANEVSTGERNLIPNRSLKRVEYQYVLE